MKGGDREGQMEDFVQFSGQWKFNIVAVLIIPFVFTYGSVKPYELCKVYYFICKMNCQLFMNKIIRGFIIKQSIM